MNRPQDELDSEGCRARLFLIGGRIIINDGEAVQRTRAMYVESLSRGVEVRREVRMRWSVPVLGRGRYHSITVSQYHTRYRVRGSQKHYRVVANNKMVPVPDALVPDLGSCDVGDRR